MLGYQALILWRQSIDYFCQDVEGISYLLTIINIVHRNKTKGAHTHFTQYHMQLVAPKAILCFCFVHFSSSKEK